MVLFKQLDNGRAHGNDVSKYEVRFTPATAKVLPDFIEQRLSYGQMADEAFDVLSPAVQTIPIRGAWHYLSSALHWQDQADFFLNLAAKAGTFSHYSCDFETSYNNVNLPFVYNCWQFIQYIKKQTGLPCLLYTNPNLYDLWIGPSQKVYGIDWGTVDLWVAQYWFLRSNSNPGMPKTRINLAPGVLPWTFWQWFEGEHNTFGPAYGMGSAGAEMDDFNGTPDQLRAKFPITIQDPTPQPPTAGFKGVTVTLTIGSDGKAAISNQVQL